MRVTRRQTLKGLAGTGAAAVLSSLSSCRLTRRPNILFVMTDDQSVAEMSCYGNRILQTPNMDRLAAEGVRFANAFVTNSLCAPSRATILTGCFSHVHGVRGNLEAGGAAEFINPKTPTFVQVLQQAGYHTAIVGKWHLNDEPKGFDYWCVLPGQGVYFDPDFIENSTRKKFRGYVTDIITDLALEFLQREGDRPWCLLYHHKAPHRPFTPAPRHARLFEEIELPYPETFTDDYATRRIAAEAVDMRLEVSLAGDYEDLPAGLSPEERKRWIFQRFVKDHYRAIYGVDENLGRILAYLDERGLAEDTAIFYTTDQGFFLGEHGWYDKRFMYEPSLRVPLVVRYPRLGVRGRVEERLVMNIDFAPTLLDLAGVPIPETMQGVSLRPLLEGHSPADWRRSTYYAYYENSWALARQGAIPQRPDDPNARYYTLHRVPPHRGVRTATHKLIHYYGEGDYWELFDLRTDPHELKNVYGEPSYASVVAELKQELERLRAYYKDTSSEQAAA